MAFTLAEVLITLGIIGVVAAMTIPALMTKIEDAVLASQTKKVYSEIIQAFKLASLEFDADGENSALFAPSNNSLAIDNILLKSLKGATICTNYNNQICKYYTVRYANKKTDSEGNLLYDAQTILGNPAIILQNGAKIWIQTSGSGCVRQDYIDADGNPYSLEHCGVLKFDVNGPKKPNQFGRDIFYLLIYNTYYTPHGGAQYGSENLKKILNNDKSIKYDNY